MELHLCVQDLPFYLAGHCVQGTSSHIFPAGAAGGRQETLQCGVVLHVSLVAMTTRPLGTSHAKTLSIGVGPTSMLSNCNSAATASLSAAVQF